MALKQFSIRSINMMNVNYILIQVCPVILSQYCTRICVTDLGLLFKSAYFILSISRFSDCWQPLYILSPLCMLWMECYCYRYRVLANICFQLYFVFSFKSGFNLYNSAEIWESMVLESNNNINIKPSFACLSLAVIWVKPTWAKIWFHNRFKIKNHWLLQTVLISDCFPDKGGSKNWKKMPGPRIMSGIYLDTVYI